jgi:hypothetical protein
MKIDKPRKERQIGHIDRRRTRKILVRIERIGKLPVNNQYRHGSDNPYAPTTLTFLSKTVSIAKLFHIFQKNKKPAMTC